MTSKFFSSFFVLVIVSPDLATEYQAQLCISYPPDSFRTVSPAGTHFLTWTILIRISVECANNALVVYSGVRSRIRFFWLSFNSYNKTVINKIFFDNIDFEKEEIKCESK